MQKELESCQREKKSLEEKLKALAMHDTRPILQRVFSDNDISIRVKHGRHPVFKVVFDNELYSVRWHGIDLGYSTYRDGLLEEVNQTLVFLWSAYAKEQSAEMTRSALKIRRLMLDFFEEM
ncbi:MAG: hypothetical protein IJJ33_11445 [Victivallales bacterium]|nr:hypothetical protein [Victivallales bacterium]